MVGFAGHYPIYPVIPGYFFQTTGKDGMAREKVIVPIPIQKKAVTVHRKGRPKVMAYELRKRELNV